MSEQTDYFTDLLVRDEPVLATIAGPGPTTKKGVGEERTWLQLAVTPFRMAAVRLVQGPAQASYRPAFRMVIDRNAVRIRRFPKTDLSAARLEIHGFGKEKLTLLDIDDQKVFPYVEPFLAAWGGHVEGSGSVVPSPTYDPHEHLVQRDRNKMVFVVAAGFLLFGACGVFTVALGLVRYLLAQP